MEMLKLFILKIISIGTSTGMEDAKRLAIQVATFDGIWTLVTMVIYLLYTFSRGNHPLDLLFGLAILIILFGLWLISKHRYDLGRYVLHLTALTQIFLTADAAGDHSGYEFYYFTSVTVPFFTFTMEERWKGFVLTGIALVVLVSQEFYGTGHFMAPISITNVDKIFSVVMAMVFIIAVLSVARWQVELTQKEVQKQQSDLIHSSNLKALGEMAGGIAHEINNPLQTLSLQSKALKDSFKDLESIPAPVAEQLETVDYTIVRITKLIKGLRDLTRDVSNDPAGYFTIKEMLEDVLNVSAERLKDLGIQLIIHGDRNLAVSGHMVQISQVVINLLNNAVDALEGSKEKWITIGFIEKNERIHLTVTDSGPGIPKEVVVKLMQPFFTTKGAGKGTGLGLSISKSIIEKNGGKFFYDATSTHTRFVIELSGVTESA